jgi:hypothetical protein
LAVGDFNGDGKPDLVVAGVGVLRNNGDGTFQSPVSYGSGGDNVAVADFDGRRYANGQPILDLVTTVGNGVNVSLGNGDGTFQSPVFYPLPVPTMRATELTSSPLAVGDFNGDGKLDIAVGNKVGGQDSVSLLLGNGDGTFQRPYVDQAFHSVQLAAAHFTGDGRPGIVSAGGDLLLPAPPDFSLSNARVAEHQPAGTVVGTFNTPTDDPNNSFTYQFVSGTGGADNAAFTLDAQGHLKTAATFDYWTKSSYSIRVRSTDVVGDISEGVFTIRVTPGATQFGVVPSVQAVLPGTPFSITVTTLDAAGQPAAYLGPVHFSSTDPQAILPPDYTFTAADHGTHTFSGLVFRSTGRQTITASNGGLGSVTEFTIPTGSSQPY